MFEFTEYSEERLIEELSQQKRQAQIKVNDMERTMAEKNTFIDILKKNIIEYTETLQKLKAT